MWFNTPSLKIWQDGRSDCTQEDFFSRPLCFYLRGSFWILIFNAACQTFRIKLAGIDITRDKSNKAFFVIGCFRFIARPCALGLKIQANGPQKAQPNAILEKVFTAITKVKTCFLPQLKRIYCFRRRLRTSLQHSFERFTAIINGRNSGLIK